MSQDLLLPGNPWKNGKRSIIGSLTIQRGLRSLLLSIEQISFQLDTVMHSHLRWALTMIFRSVFYFKSNILTQEAFNLGNLVLL